jgi:chromosome partitioning protein
MLIDCPPSLGLLTLNALVASHAVLIPIQCEYYALEGLSSLLKTIRLVRRTLNPSLPFLGVVLTMYDRRVKLTSQVEDEIRAFFKEIVFETTIPRNVKLSEAPSFGKPIVLYDILSRGAESYMLLAKEVIARG